MASAKLGDSVKVHYEEKLENGEIVKTSKGGEPLGLTIGRKIVPFLEIATKGMEIGEKKIIKVPPEQAYGLRSEKRIVEVKRSSLTRETIPDIGDKITLKKKDGDRIGAVITDVDKETITVDANHPLAGKVIVFEIELLEIA
jgi:peptidylprolyl isomerase